MRLLLASIGMCAMIAFAAPAYGDPNAAADDTGFLSDLQRADIGYPDPGQAIRSARAVCTCLNGGESGLELIHDVRTHNPAFNMDAAATFAVISAKYFCPQQLSEE